MIDSELRGEVEILRKAYEAHVKDLKFKLLVTKVQANKILLSANKAAVRVADVQGEIISTRVDLKSCERAIEYLSGERPNRKYQATQEGE